MNLEHEVVIALPLAGATSDASTEINFRQHKDSTSSSDNSNEAGLPGTDGSIVDASSESLPAELLLRCIWPTPARSHQIGVMDRHRQHFRNVPVSGVEDALQRAGVASAAGQEAYFALAEYRTSESRTAVNVQSICAFWFDIDCGESKGQEAKGYRTCEEGEQELALFLAANGLPEPTHLVYSGGGLHAYFVMDSPIDREQWVERAAMLKALTKACNLLADPSRTADCASVLRVPGTLNYKYDPPALVVLRTARPPIATGALLRAIAHAHERLCSPKLPLADLQIEAADGSPSGGIQGKDFGPPDVPRVRSALEVLDPDCDESTWKLHRLAPLARAARDHPELADALCELARRWSSGELRGLASRAWTTPGATSGVTGEVAFEKEWRRFMRGQYAGQHTTIGTIYHDARKAGWDGLSSSPVPVPNPTAALDEFAENQEAATAIVERVREGDIGAPLESASVEVFTFFAKKNPAEYQRIRARLKEADSRVSISAIELAVKEALAEKEVAPTHHGYAVDILDRLTVEGVRPVMHEGVLYVLDSQRRIFVGQQPSQLERLVAETHDGRANCKREADYAGIARHARGLAGDDKFFAAAPVGLACLKNFYRIADGKVVIEPLTAAHRQRVLLDLVPQADATPLFDAFLHETFKSERPGEEDEQRALVQELAGAIMLGVAHRFQKAFLFYDPYGRAGKGTLESIIRQLVPGAFVVAVSPFNWEKEYFVVTLAGARLNVVGELPENVSIPGAIFKSVIGGDLIMGRHPTHRPITFKNGAAHIFMSNHMISSHDQSEALFARWGIIEFPNSRLRSGEPLDPDLAERIVASELPGIAHWALDGATRLLANNKYSPSAAHDRLMQKWRRGNSSLHEFIADACDQAPEHHVTRASLYDTYRRWCTGNGRKPYAKARVKELLECNVSLDIRLAVLDGNEIFRGLRVRPGEEYSF